MEQPHVLLVDCLESVRRWPLLQCLHWERAHDWEQGLKVIQSQSFDFVLANEPPPLSGLPPTFTLAEFEPVKGVSDHNFVRLWLEQVVLNQKLSAQLQATRAQQVESQQLFEFAPSGSLIVARNGRILRANQRAAEILGRPRQEVEQVPLTAFLPPEDIDRVLTQLWAYLQGSDPGPWQLRVRDLEGRIRMLNVSGSLLPGSPSSRVQLALVDTTMEMELSQQLSRLQHEHQAVLDELIDGVLISNQYGRILSSNRAARQLLGKEAEELHGRHWQELGIHIQQDTVDPQIAWCAGPAGKPFLAEFRLSLRKESGRLQSTLIIRDLTLVRKARVELVELRERERAAVGQELHDDLGQMLTALSYVAEVLAGRLGKTPELQEMARQISTLAKQSIAKTRAIARGLYPVVLERSGLVGALQDLASTTEEFFGVSCRLRAGPSRLDRRLSLHLFRIAQEAITNAVKHASCRSIEIFLRSDESRIWLEVADDGKGIDPASRAGLGLGMRSMRQHIELIEGDLEVDSSLGSGTRIRCWAPHGQA